MKIIDYKIITRENMVRLENAIHLQIKLGWQPIGGLQVFCIENKMVQRFYQAMVKYVNKVDCKRCNATGQALGCTQGLLCNLCNGKGFNYEESK